MENLKNCSQYELNSMNSVKFTQAIEKACREFSSTINLVIEEAESKQVVSLCADFLFADCAVWDLESVGCIFQEEEWTTVNNPQEEREREWLESLISLTVPTSIRRLIAIQLFLRFNTYTDRAQHWVGEWTASGVG